MASGMNLSGSVVLPGVLTCEAVWTVGPSSPEISAGRPGPHGLHSFKGLGEQFTHCTGAYAVKANRGSVPQTWCIFTALTFWLSCSCVAKSVRT